MKFRRPWALAVSAFLVASSMSCDSSDSGPTAPKARQPTRPMPIKYVQLATHLADGFQTDINEPQLKQPLPQLLADYRNRALDLQQSGSDDPDIEAVTQQACEAFHGAVTALERLDALPKPPDAGEQFIEGFLRGLVLAGEGAAERDQEIRGQQDAILGELRSVIAAAKRAESAKLMLPRIAKKYAGPAVESGVSVAADFNAAWGHLGPDDWMFLYNNSSLVLHNSTVLVELRGIDGDVHRNLHFIPAWEQETWICARYEAGTPIPALKDTFGAMSVANVQTALISIWAEELSQESIVYDYAGKEFDRDVERYCQDLKIRASYQAFEPGLLWNTERGVVATLDGLPFVMKPTVTVRFEGGGPSKSWFWTFDSWSQNERKTFSPGKQLSWDPDRYTIEITFPATSYQYRQVWDRKSGPILGPLPPP